MFNHVDGAWDALSADQQNEHQVWLQEFMQELEEKKNSRLVFFDMLESPRTVAKDIEGAVNVGVESILASGERPGGYYLIEAESLDEALKWARKGRFMIGSSIVFPITSYEF
jgi:hypothetical protein